MVMATGSSRDRPDVDALRVYLNVVGEALWGQVGDEALDRGWRGGASARSRGRRVRRWARVLQRRWRRSLPATHVDTEDRFVEILDEDAYPRSQ